MNVTVNGSTPLVGLAVKLAVGAPKTVSVTLVLVMTPATLDTITEYVPASLGWAFEMDKEALVALTKFVPALSH